MIEFSNWLKNSGIKITPHKLAVLSILKTHKHLNVIQINQLLNNSEVNISTATIYRILASFEEHKIVNKLNFGNEQAIYELNYNQDHHDHLICIKCGLVIEFNDNKIEEHQNNIAAKNNFTVTSHTLNIYGKCHKCNNI